MVLIGLLLVAVVSLVLGLALASVGLADRLAGGQRAGRRGARAAGPQAAPGATWHEDGKSATESGRRRGAPPASAESVGPPQRRRQAMPADGRAESRRWSSTAGPIPPRRLRVGSSASRPRVPFRWRRRPRTASVPVPGLAVRRAGPARSAGATSADVWVVDGSPEYHRARLLDAGRPTRPSRSRCSQAVEDGFTPCDGVPPPESASPAARRRRPTVRAPRRRRPAGRCGSPTAIPSTTCRTAASSTELKSEPVPYEQAVEDGFQPCVVCNPDAVFAGRRPQSPSARRRAGPRSDEDRATLHRRTGTRGGPDGTGTAVASEPRPRMRRRRSDRVRPPRRPSAAGDGRAPSDVWVADGYPEYHREPAASELSGLPEEPVPYDQAVEDGFRALPGVPARVGRGAGRRTPRLPPAARPAVRRPTPPAEAAAGRLGRRRLPRLPPHDVRASWSAWSRGDPARPGASRTASARARSAPRRRVGPGGTGHDRRRGRCRRARCRRRTAPMPTPLPGRRTHWCRRTPLSRTRCGSSTGTPTTTARAAGVLSGLDAEADAVRPGRRGRLRRVRGLPADATRRPVRSRLRPTPTAAGGGARCGWSTASPTTTARAAGRWPACPASRCPYDQAVEDGFTPCSVCQPDAAAPPAGAAIERPDRAPADPSRTSRDGDAARADRSGSSTATPTTTGRAVARSRPRRRAGAARPGGRGRLRAVRGVPAGRARGAGAGAGRDVGRSADGGRA